MTTTKRNYRGTFIIDNRGQEESIDKLIEDVKTEIAAVQGEVTAVESLGKRDFVRVTDKKFTSGVYVQITFDAPPEGPAQLKERFRLNNTVYRIFIETL
ncbi:small subunit ribosomal protein S6 [Ereboglobus sp. PH5-5]|uniref:30S ribosomal protein S6 n=1 Tax=unclassified Ereboglobus TaxID=2626932 RepID=UPI0024061F5B|nr:MULTISPECIES: 30S ribosomal protein S6 [unclassified Ereboglobus]MDF9828032.1 small subunit ribosomal protein S6 [Ereboglobus sp. PH5-10]MDF9832274.1 small subunit ribosomal protein S6 [Ereboglobus sp. PH5-5]